MIIIMHIFNPFKQINRLKKEHTPATFIEIYFSVTFKFIAKENYYYRAIRF